MIRMPVLTPAITPILSGQVASPKYTSETRPFRQHHLRGEQRITERLEAIKRARPLTTDEGVLIPSAHTYALRPFPPTTPSRHVLLTPEAWARSLCQPCPHCAFLMPPTPQPAAQKAA